MLAIIRTNFHLSVLISIFISALVLADRTILFKAGYMTHNPLTNNLLFIPAILSAIQLILWFGRYRNGGQIEAFLMGFFFLFVIAGMQFYTTLNHIPISPTLSFVYLYIGLSHIAYFATKTKPGRMEA